MRGKLYAGFPLPDHGCIRVEVVRKRENMHTVKELAICEAGSI